MTVIARDVAVEVVDTIHGYTMEFAPSPEAHREEYARAERVIARALATSEGAVPLTDGEAETLDRLLDAYIATTLETDEWLPNLRAVREKLTVRRGQSE